MKNIFAIIAIYPIFFASKMASACPIPCVNADADLLRKHAPILQIQADQTFLPVSIGATFYRATQAAKAKANSSDISKRYHSEESTLEFVRARTNGAPTKIVGRVFYKPHFIELFYTVFHRFGDCPQQTMAYDRTSTQAQYYKATWCNFNKPPQDWEDIVIRIRKDGSLLSISSSATGILRKIPYFHIRWRGNQPVLPSKSTLESLYLEQQGMQNHKLPVIASKKIRSFAEVDLAKSGPLALSTQGNFYLWKVPVKVILQKTPEPKTPAP